MHHKREARITSSVISLGDDAQRMIPVAFSVGLIGLGGAAALSIFSGSGGLVRFSYAYLLNFCFFATISLGALFFVTVQHLTRAGWSVTVRRIAELLAMTIVPMFLLALPLVIPVLLGWSGLYPWNAADWTERYSGHVLASVEKYKGYYLDNAFFSVRTLVYFAIWSGMAWFFYRNSLRQDQTGDPGLTLKMQKYAAPLMIVFAGTLVFASFDWEMSLEPMWFSTMFPVYFFAGCVLGGVATMLLIGLLLQRSGRVTDEITTDNFQDLGKLIFAFIVFWGYVAFSQFMLIWYANIPEETFYFGYRFDNAGYRWLSVVLLFGHIFIPFLLLMPRTLKRDRRFMLGAALYMLAMHWLDHFWIVMPQYGFDGKHVAQFPFPLVELVCLVGFSGLFVGFFCLIAADRPLVPLKDPRLGEALNYTNL